MKEEMSFLSHYELIQKGLTIISYLELTQGCKDGKNYYTTLLMVLESKMLLHAIWTLRSIARRLP